MICLLGLQNFDEDYEYQESLINEETIGDYVEIEPSPRSEETPQGNHHRFGRSDVDTHPSLDRRTWHVEPGKLDEGGGVRNPSVGPSADYSTGMDIIHDRQKSW